MIRPTIRPSNVDIWSVNNKDLDEPHGDSDFAFGDSDLQVGDSNLDSDSQVGDSDLDSDLPVGDSTTTLVCTQMEPFVGDRPSALPTGDASAPAKRNYSLANDCSC